MGRLSSITTLLMILATVFYAITNEYFWLFIVIVLINGVVSISNYIRKFYIEKYW